MGYLLFLLILGLLGLGIFIGWHFRGLKDYDWGSMEVSSVVIANGLTILAWLLFGLLVYLGTHAIYTFIILFLIWFGCMYAVFDDPRIFRMLLASTAPQPTPEPPLEFPSKSEIRDAILEELPPHSGSVREMILSVIDDLYDLEPLQLPPRPPISLTPSCEIDRYQLLKELRTSIARDTQAAARHFQSTLVSVLKAYLRLLPPPGDGISFGTVPLHEYVPDLTAAIESVLKPLADRNSRSYSTTEHRRLGLFYHLHNALTDEWYKEPPEDAHQLIRYYLNCTPLEILFRAEVPITIPDELRFRHQWVIGAPGTGKTTYLATSILHDFARVANGEATVVVMDSQNELIPQLARLRLFAPEQPLHDKLIYLEPSVEYPLALNLFDSTDSAALDEDQREQHVRTAVELAKFFLASIMKADMTANMDIYFRYLIPAAMSVPGATISTLKEMVDGRKFDLSRADPELRAWVEKRMSDRSYKLTREAIKARLDAFTADKLFRRMFSHPRSKFDFFEELKTPKVILINANAAVLRDRLEPFGRFFIAKLLHATEQRMMLPVSERLPVYFYVDEATEYIAEETNIAELIDRARKQRVALTLAHQRESQIESANVLDALRHTAIQSRTDKPCLHVALPDRSMTISFNPIDLTTLPTMSDAQWQQLLQRMRNRYATHARVMPSTSAHQAADVRDDDLPHTTEDY